MTLIFKRIWNGNIMLEQEGILKTYMYASN